MSLLNPQEIARIRRWHGDLGDGLVAELCDRALATDTVDTHELIADLIAALAWTATTSARAERGWIHIAQPALDRGRDYLKSTT